MSHSTHSLSSTNSSDERTDRTFDAVRWDALASLACSFVGATSSRWGDQFSGGYNLVRFLHFNDANTMQHSVLVVRVPYRPRDGWIIEHSKPFASQMSSEVATMRYIAAHTSIPVPRVIHHSVEADSGGVGSPYMIMTKVEGMQLSSVWDDMEDTQREIVLRQVVDILLELASHRFDKIGMLLEREGDDPTKQPWYVAPSVQHSDDISASQDIESAVTFTSAVDYWLDTANHNIKRICDVNFGSRNKIYDYSHAWFIRSLIPSLYDPSLDAAGFPICPGDFHSQNIMVINPDTSPRITGVIDWEFSSTNPTSTFAQYPLFVVDHPLWDDDDPLRKRNIRDQATFDVLMREAEMKKDPTGGLPLSQAFASCKGAYLFEQALQFEYTFSVIYPQLFEHIFGGGDFPTEYYWALIKEGILRKEEKQFDHESEVWEEANKVLGEELVSSTMKKDEFIGVVREHIVQFPEGGLVREWLATLR